MLRTVRFVTVVGIITVAATTAALLRALRRVRGHWFDSGGVRLHYTVEGAGEPVVLLHGFAVNADINWRLPGITRGLANEFQVIAMDLRGHGLSDKPHDAGQYGMEMVQDVVRLLDHLGIGKAHAVGYSLGGIVTLKLAATHPERLLSAAPLGAGWERPDNSVFLEAIEEIGAALKSGQGIGPLSGNLGGDREKPGFVHHLLVKLMTRYLTDGHALGDLVHALPNLAVAEQDVRCISVPVCSIVGSRDPMKVGVDAMRGLVPDLEVVLLDGANHISAVRRPELLQAMLSFLQRNGGSASGDGADVSRTAGPGSPA